ncbi:MAG: GMC family oxidoreductase, partial [Spirochaetota bacterium]|nr:GMC family oxidoreductase [Spirochaetota bacterium]
MKLKKSYEYIIIGSGFGGAFAAYNLAKAGKEVLVIERGKWAVRDDSCWDERRLHIENPLYRGFTPVNVDQKKGKIEEDWPDDTVGGMSTFYGAAAFRMREDDFLGAPIPGSYERDKISEWPFGYKELAPFYDEAERLQGVAGIKGADIFEPARKKDYPHAPPKNLAFSSKLVKDSAEEIGLHPFHIPLAINFSGKYGKEKCILCDKCDHYICKIEGKNDLSVSVLPKAIEYGATVLADTRAIKINISNNQAKSVDIIDHSTGESLTIKTKRVIVACGALSTPHLLLSSGIGGAADSGELIGRYLMRHTNGVISGLFPFKTNPRSEFQKQIAITDFCYGSFDKKSEPKGNWGIIQDFQMPGKEVLKEFSP